MKVDTEIRGTGMNIVVEMIVHGYPVRIIEEPYECGGRYVWYIKRPNSGWTMIGCVCHNPALGL